MCPIKLFCDLKKYASQEICFSSKKNLTTPHKVYSKLCSSDLGSNTVKQCSTKFFGFSFTFFCRFLVIASNLALRLDLIWSSSKSSLLWCEKTNPLEFLLRLLLPFCVLSMPFRLDSSPGFIRIVLVEVRIQNPPILLLLRLPFFRE